MQLMRSNSCPCFRKKSDAGLHDIAVPLIVYDSPLHVVYCESGLVNSSACGQVIYASRMALVGSRRWLLRFPISDLIFRIASI